MQSRLAIVVAALTLFGFSGCASNSVRRGDTSVSSAVKDYDLAYKAMLEVMSRHFLIREANRASGIVTAMPIHNSDGRMGKAKTEVSAKVFASPRGGYDIEVRARNFVELSEPYTLSSRTPRYEWHETSFDNNLEAQLLNEINLVRFKGQQAAYENTFLETPKDAYAPPVN